MGRILLGLFLAIAVAGAWAQTGMPVRGIIVTLKPQADSGRDSPQAARERIQGVARDAGVDLAASRRIGARHHLIGLPRAQDGTTLENTLRRLRLHPNVLAAEPDVLIRPQQAVTPNDPDFGLQWHLPAPTTHASAINLPPAWAATTGTAVVVAVLDTGVLADHPDLLGRVLPGYDMVSEVEYANDGDGRDADASDPGDWVSITDRNAQPALFGSCPLSSSSWHGTFISAQIAAQTNNAQGVAGINWAANIQPVRVSGKCGAFLSDILDGLRWAAGLSVDGAPPNATPARIINLSFGGDAVCSASYQSVIDEVTDAGSLVVVAAGNESGPLRRPADCARVMAVGSVDENGAKATYSNFGSKVALMAPGGTGSSNLRIYSAGNSGAQGPVAHNYGYKSGTSFSVPLAVGVGSLMLAINPGLSPAQLIARMKAGSRAHAVNPSLNSCFGSFALSCNCTTTTCGAGMLDAELALAQSQAPAAVISAPTRANPGATIVLDGQASAAVSGGSITQYQWSQLSGAAVEIRGSTSALASVTLPVAAGVFEFKLVVTDDSSRVGEDTARVSTEPESETVASSGGGSGGGAMGWPWGVALVLLAAAAVWLRVGRPVLPRRPSRRRLP